MSEIWDINFKKEYMRHGTFLMTVSKEESNDWYAYRIDNQEDLYHIKDFVKEIDKDQKGEKSFFNKQRK